MNSRIMQGTYSSIIDRTWYYGLRETHSYSIENVVQGTGFKGQR